MVVVSVCGYLCREEVAQSRMFDSFKKTLISMLETCNLQLPLDGILVYGLGTLQNVSSRRQVIPQLAGMQPQAYGHGQCRCC